ncbi:acetyltransferase [uncultured Ruegeria sp.]|uniref:acetyltransferase n=1 Tax=uncultured Ruegeria sp. TaxID=259304 RepID=UPI002621BE32|nr:acetyltransferase [uncultured Ruegeria sp.]
MTTPLLIVGAGEFADIAHEYFSTDSDYEVVGFAVEAAYRESDTHRGLPLVDVESIEERFDPTTIQTHVAVTNTQLNRVRERLVELMRNKGYRFANYVSSHAFVWRTAQLGDNVFVFENNVVQHGVKIGDGVVLWSGNHVGHQSQIEDFCFLSSHVVVSGYCKIGRRSFVGVNAAFADNIEIGEDCFVGLGAVVNKSFKDPGQLLTGHPAEPSRVSTYRYFKLAN